MDSKSFEVNQKITWNASKRKTVEDISCKIIYKPLATYQQRGQQPISVILEKYL